MYVKTSSEKYSMVKNNWQKEKQKKYGRQTLSSLA